VSFILKLLSIIKEAQKKGLGKSFIKMSCLPPSKKERILIKNGKEYGKKVILKKQ
jgi:hypothetical protein